MIWALVVAGVAAIGVVLKVASSWERFQADWDDVLPEARQTYPTVLIGPGCQDKPRAQEADTPPECPPECLPGSCLDCP